MLKAAHTQQHQVNRILLLFLPLSDHSTGWALSTVVDTSFAMPESIYELTSAELQTLVDKAIEAKATAYCMTPYSFAVVH